MFLLDTNVLLKYPSIFTTFKDNITISIRVIEEIDRLKNNSNPEVAYEARRASHKIFKDMDNIRFCHERYEPFIVDDALLALAKDENFTLVTNDLNLILKCKAENIDWQTYDKIETNYTGIHYLSANCDEYFYNENLDEILKKRVPPFHMAENEFLIVKDQNNKILCELIYNNGMLKYLHDYVLENDYINKIVPRNSEQRCLMELLFNKEISILAATGEYGTGKSYLLTNYALQQLQKGNINKIVYVPNNSIVQDSRELGTLPGDTIDKELIYMGPILDIIGEDKARDMIINNEIEIVPISIMRGRSFTNSIIIVNEAQNLTTEHIKLLIARCGEDTRIFFDGDIKQSDSHIFKNKSGLKLLLHLAESEEFAKIFGTVRLNEIERSKTAQASAYLEKLLI